MSLSARAIAVSGLGFGALLTAAVGLHDISQQTIQDIATGPDNHSKAQIAHAKHVYSQPHNSDLIDKNRSINSAKSDATVQNSELISENRAIKLNDRGLIQSIDLAQPTQALTELKQLMVEASEQVKQYQHDHAVLQRQQNLRAAMLALIELI